MMPDKGLNFFDECASECVHLYSGRIEYLFCFEGTINVHNCHHSQFTEDATSYLMLMIFWLFGDLFR